MSAPVPRLKSTAVHAPFHGKVAWVTGASSGIGAATALELAAKGASVALFARRQERLTALARRIEALGVETLVIAGDVTRGEDLERAVAQILDRFGRLDVVVANAGFGVSGRFDELEVEDFRRQFETNVFGVVRTARAALPALLSSKGSLAIVGSVNGFLSLPGNAPYGMSKFAVRSLAESLWLELGPQGVAVTHVAPGFVESEIRMVNNHGEHMGKKSAEAPRWLVVSAEKAARHIVRAIAKRKREIVVTGHGKVVVFLNRFFRECWFPALRALGVSARPEPKG